MIQYYTKTKFNYVGHLLDQHHALVVEIRHTLADMSLDDYLRNKERLDELIQPVDDLIYRREEISDNYRIQVICLVINELNIFKKELLK
jgi:hypothetical protein